MFDSIRAWLKQNKNGASLVGGAAAVAITCAIAGGCALSDWVRVDVPRQVQMATGAPDEVSLTDAPEVMEDYVRYGERFASEIDDANATLGWLLSAADIGLRVGGASLPGGGLAVLALTGLGGLLLKGPGTAKEKEASFNKGRKEAEAALLPLLAAAGIDVPAPKEDDVA